MTTKSHEVHLGQEAFFILNGSVIRTAVGTLTKDGYQLLDKRHQSGQRHWFSFDRARAAADVLLKSRQEALRRQIKELDRRRRKQATPAYRQEVMMEKMRVSVSRDVDEPVRARYLRKVPVPESYYRPGDVVYMVVEPSTVERYDAYRPYFHYVLELEVLKVSVSQDREVYYEYSTPFEVTQTFVTLDEAKSSLRARLGLGDNESVQVVSREEDRRGLAQIRDIPF